MEPIYTKPESSAPLFMEAAIQIATQMGLPLYSQQDMNGNSYKNSSASKESVLFLPGRAPFEYFDSLGEGVRERQEETIQAVKISP
ncbi:hypothetical protein [Endozoicomonas ascidiicola]|uniref:hypothetical protein n=1 Tax=Endozoicomonas ascidiicola TaxID=1698521 RepID=UPI00082B2096|nr:hypothetical protein [Endozoicomonas ascidiicola]